MQLSGRPLWDTRADAALFVDPAGVLARLRRAGGAGLNVLLVGERGAGKTTLLRQLLRAARGGAGLDPAAEPAGAGPPPVLVDAAPADSTAALLRAVTRALGRDVPGPQRAGDGADAGALLERLRVAAGDAWDTSEASAAGDASDVSDTRPGAPRLVLVDGLSAPVAHAVFGQLRDELWSLPYTWVVACADTDEAAFLRPPADAFFDTVVRLPPLPADAVRDLLRRRITEAELPADAVTTAVELADGNPRRALDAARRLALEPEGAPDLRRERAGRARALGALGRPAAMLMAELEASGGASASDPALLARLGWTRARAAQVLGLLADAGLVQPVDVRNGPGRPRRVYRPTAG